MKKRIAIIVGLLVLVLAGLVVTAVVRANDVVRILQPKIEQRLTKLVGAPVNIGTVDISLFPNIQLVVRDITLGGEAAPSVAAVRAKLALRPLLSRKLDASEFRVSQPRITITRGKQGFSIAGLSGQAASGSQSQPAPAPQPSASSESAAASSSSESFQLHLERVLIENGSVTIQDLEAGTTSTISDLDLDAQVQLQGALLSVPKAELRVGMPGAGPLSLALRSASLNHDTGTLAVSDAVFTSDAGSVRAEAALELDSRRGTIKASSDKLDIAALVKHAQPFVPSLSKFTPRGTLVIPRCEITLAGADTISFGSALQLRDSSFVIPDGQSVQAISGDISLEGTTTALSFSSRQLSLNINRAPIILGIDGQFRKGAPSSVTLSRFDVRAFDGTGNIPGALQLSSPLQVRASADLKGMSIQSILSTFYPEHAANFSGTIATLNTQVSGPLGPPAPNIRGPGSISVKNATLKGFNLPLAVLNSVGKGLPFLEKTLVESIPPEFQGMVREPDTRIHSLDSTFELQGSLTVLRSLEAVGDIFTLRSSGSIARDGTLDLTMTLTFTPEFSRALAERIKDISKVYDSSGRLVIPLSLKGRAPQLLVLPDLSKLMQTGAGRIIEREAGRAIDKALGKDSDTARGVKDLLGGFLRR